MDETKLTARQRQILRASGGRELCSIALDLRRHRKLLTAAAQQHSANPEALRDLTNAMLSTCDMILRLAQFPLPPRALAVQTGRSKPVLDMPAPTDKP